MSRNTYFRGENALIKFNVIDKADAPITWANMEAIVVVLEDSAGHTQSYSKALGSVVQGDLTNQIKFEITEAHTSGFVPGKVRAKFTYTITNGAYASGHSVDTIVEEDFITIQ